MSFVLWGKKDSAVGNYRNPRDCIVKGVDISETVGPVKDINSTFSLETAKKNEYSMEIAECTKGGYKEVNPKIVDKYSSSIIAYTDTCTGSHLPAMDRTAKEKYDPNDIKDVDSKLEEFKANETLENDARAAFEASEIDKVPMNDDARSPLKEITKSKITKAVTSQTEEQSLVRYYLLDCPNVWLDKYRYEDAEEQYYKHLARDQHKEVFQTSNNKITFLDPVKDKEVKVNVNDIDSEYKNDAAKGFSKPKQKVFYEIIEEIVERTEITYKLIRNDNDDAHME